MNEKKAYPKVLIIGQTFHKKSGGGVTLSNLFEGWPKDRLAVAGKSNLRIDTDTSVCEIYYQLTYKNKLHPFPLSFILPKVKNGQIEITKGPLESKAIEGKKLTGGRFKIIYSILEKALHFFGVYNFLYKLKLTPEFKKWIQEFNPDIIYTQLESLELIRLVDEIHSESRRKIAIHIMDDWPLTVNKPGLLYFYWGKIINNEFRRLLDKASVLMSISDAMSEEYRIRYNKQFIPFHNPIDIKYWKPATEKDFSIKDTFTILYAGRIGWGIEKSIAEVAAAVNDPQIIKKNIIFEIQTGDIDTLSKAVVFNDNVKWKEPIAYSKLPEKFSSVDLLLMPQDFDEKSVRFLKYSYPTKASEYMISGTPILVYGDIRTGLTKQAMQDKWAYVVTENNTAALVKALLEIYKNPALRKELSQTAQKISLEKEDAEVVREKFRKSFIINQDDPFETVINI